MESQVPPMKEFDLQRHTNPLFFLEDVRANSGEKGTLFYIDFAALSKGMSSKQAYDCLKFLACLQGIVNREKPVLFIEFITENETDAFWYAYLRLEGKLLYGYKRQDLESFSDVLNAFTEVIRTNGLVLWDEAVPATANVATTVCGVEGWLPVRYDPDQESIYSRIIAACEPDVKLDLCGKFIGEGSIPDTSLPSSGSAKCDAYLWAAELYLNKTNLEKMAYVLDGASWEDNTISYPDLSNAFVPNQDYFVAEKMFVFDLSVWDDELPCDDPEQPLGTDLATMKTILQKQYDRSGGSSITQISGFIPWQIKYTRHLNKGKHGEVETEWRYAEILSAYNCAMDADAAGYCGLSNASLYALYPLKDFYKGNRPQEKRTYDPIKKYVLLYMGDYDCAPWMVRFIPQWWNDSARGEVPLNWAFNPNLSERIAMVFDYIYETMLPTDFFISGDSGAGYLNPSLLVSDPSRSPSRVHSDNPSGLEAWIAYNQRYFRQFDLSIVGFLLNGSQPMLDPVYSAYARFAPDGVICNQTNPDIKVVDGTVFATIPAYLDNDPMNSAAIIRTVTAQRENQNRFTVFRCVLCSPTYAKQLADEVHRTNPEIEFLDAYTYFDLLKQSLGIA